MKSSYSLESNHSSYLSGGLQTIQAVILDEYNLAICRDIQVVVDYNITQLEEPIDIFTNYIETQYQFVSDEAANGDDEDNVAIDSSIITLIASDIVFEYIDSNNLTTNVSAIRDSGLIEFKLNLLSDIFNISENLVNGTDNTAGNQLSAILSIFSNVGAPLITPDTVVADDDYDDGDMIYNSDELDEIIVNFKNDIVDPIVNLTTTDSDSDSDSFSISDDSVENTLNSLSNLLQMRVLANETNDTRHENGRLMNEMSLIMANSLLNDDDILPGTSYTLGLEYDWSSQISKISVESVESSINTNETNIISNACGSDVANVSLSREYLERLETDSVNCFIQGIDYNIFEPQEGFTSNRFQSSRYINVDAFSTNTSGKYSALIIEDPDYDYLSECQPILITMSSVNIS